MGKKLIYYNFWTAALHGLKLYFLYLLKAIQCFKTSWKRTFRLSKTPKI